MQKEEVREFELATKGVRFLFNNKKLQSYCNGLRSRAVEIAIAKEETKPFPPASEARLEVTKSRNEELKWFGKQLEKEIPKRFAPFLKIRG